MFRGHCVVRTLCSTPLSKSILRLWIVKFAVRIRIKVGTKISIMTIYLKIN